MNHRTAYTVVVIDTRTAQVTHVGIYSEETPTMASRHYVSAVLATLDAQDFHTAARMARLVYHQNYPALARRFPAGMS